jgi:hypothetical protein
MGQGVTKIDKTRCYRLTDAQVEEVARIQRALREGRGKLATDDEMAALWKSCGLSPDASAKTV